MFIAALFMIAKIWKLPKCPSVDEWIEKLWYIHTMEYVLVGHKIKERKRQVPYGFTYMWSLMNKIN